MNKGKTRIRQKRGILAMVGRMRVLIAGASGFLGRSLVPALTGRGHTVTRLVRRPAAAPDERTWDPAAGVLDPGVVAEADAVINLAGAGVGDHRWTDAYKAEILHSRVDTTSLLASVMAQAAPQPTVLLNASAIGWYGDTGDRAVDESAPAGTGFLADVVRDWEAATQSAQDAGIRVVRLRTGLVVAKDGGAWQRLFPIFQLGLGGRMGSGRQYWSWISLRDELAAIAFCLENDEIRGPVNLTGPTPVTNADVASAMGSVLSRPTILPVPAFALKAALGEFSTEILSSSRVLPRVLESAGFTWQDPTIVDAVRAART